MMVDLAAIVLIPLFQKNAPTVIGVNHEHLAGALSLFDERIHGLIPQFVQTHINADMTAHLADEIHFIGPQGNFAI